MTPDTTALALPREAKFEWKEGFVEDMPFEDYCAVDAMNGSSLVHLRRSPMYFKFMRDNPQPPTSALVLGTAAHRMILEPNRIGDFAVWGTLPEEKVRNGKVWENFKRLNEGALVVTKAERDAMVGVTVAVRKSALAMKYVAAPGPTEVSMFWTDKSTGRRMKGRIDKLIEKSHTIVDLKSTRDCTPYRFGGQAYTLGYHIKAAIYWSGYKALTGKEASLRFIAVESKKPHECAVYRMSTDVLVQGLEDLQNLEALLEKCESANDWPPAQQAEDELSLPSYAYTPQEELGDLDLIGETYA